MSENYDATRAGQRMRGLFANLNRALNEPRDQRGMLLAFEALCVESLLRTAWLLRARGEHDQAAECDALVDQLRQAVNGATE